MQLSWKLDQPTIARANQVFLAASNQNGRQDFNTGVDEAVSMRILLTTPYSSHVGMKDNYWWVISEMML